MYLSQRKFETSKMYLSYLKLGKAGNVLSVQFTSFGCEQITDSQPLLRGPQGLAKNSLTQSPNNQNYLTASKE